MNKIEFIKGEPTCRYNGILCNDDGLLKIYGYNEDLCTIDDTTIIHENILYTDHDLYQVIYLISTYQGPSDEYDEIVNKGYGFASYCEHSHYDNSYIISENLMDIFTGVKQIKPFASFKEDYPEISLEKYFEFQDALNEFYTNLK